jgi:glucokinase
LQEFGVLETVLTGAGIVKSWNYAIAKLGAGVSTAPRKVTALEVLDLASAGDQRATKIIHQRARIVADVIVNLSLVLNPGLILLSGEVGGHPALLRSVMQELEHCEFAVPRIDAAALGQTAVLWGAIALALEAIPSLLLPV